MRILTSVVLGVSIACAGSATIAADPEGSNHQTVSLPCTTIAGRGMGYQLNNFALANEPDWDPASGAPAPLSRNQAVAIARGVLPKDTPDVRNWKVTKVELTSACCPKRWYYTVSWMPEGHKGDALEIPVLMSGKPGELGICFTVS